MSLKLIYPKAGDILHHDAFKDGYLEYFMYLRYDCKAKTHMMVDLENGGLLIFYWPLYCRDWCKI